MPLFDFRRRSYDNIPSFDSRRRENPVLGEEVDGRVNHVPEDAFHERNRALHTHKNVPHDSQLKPQEINFHEEENRQKHHTKDFESPGLIVRRGQLFSMSMTFDRPMDPKRDALILQFVTGSRPQESKDSLIRVHEVQNLSSSSWGFQVAKTSGNVVSLSVMPPAKAIVGEYSIYLETKTKTSDNGKELSLRQKSPATVIILFNAWCQDDAVYMEDEAHREEYVLNDRGRIWLGSKDKMTVIPWAFGQFESVALCIFLKLLDMGELSPLARANPTAVCRTISKMANFNDNDGGVLFGRWSKTYPKHTTKPTEWAGSVAILKKFDQLFKVVRYGQCWVFSGLVTTLLRAAGIPSRCVTNYESAHDTDQSMTIDFHFDWDGKPMDELNDSVWNFHVWNESYFTRPDLPAGYDGWQAHDATPQETSEGVFRCGPCPVKAVKNGEVYIPFDTGFVFGEVNGDKVYWNVDVDGEMTVSYIDKGCIGKNISTKAVGSNDRENITDNYKYPEGSPEERNAVEQANKFSSRKDKQIYLKPTSDDVAFEIRTNDHTMMTMIGKDFESELFVKNNSKEPRTIQIAISPKVTFYTGISAKDLNSLEDSITLTEGEGKSITLPIKAADYIDIASDSSVKIFYKATVKETGQTFSNIGTVELSKPLLQINIKELKVRDLKKKRLFDITFKFVNPLLFPLTNGVLNIECPRMEPNAITKRLSNSVGPQQPMSVTVTVESKSPGKRIIAGSFKSDELCGVRGDIEYTLV